MSAANRDHEHESREELLREIESLRAREAEQSARSDRLQHQCVSLAREYDSVVAEMDQRRIAWGRYARLFDGAPVALLTLDHAGVIREANRAAAALLRYDHAALQDKPFIVAAKMVDPTPFWRHLERCFATRRRIATEVQLRDGEARTRTVELVTDASHESLTGPPLATVAIVDIEERIRTEHEVRRVSEEHRRIGARLEAQMRASAAIGHALADMGSIGVDGVLQVITEQAQHLVDAEVAALGTGGAPDQLFERWLESGVSAQAYLAAVGRLPRRVGVIEEVARGRVVRTADVASHPSFVALPEGHFPVTSFLGVPFRRGGRPIGSLYVSNKRAGREFDDDDERSLVLFADLAAFAIEAALAAEAETRERVWLQAVVDQIPDGITLVDAKGQMIVNSNAAVYFDPNGPTDPMGNPSPRDLRSADGQPIGWEERPLVRALRQRETIANVEVVAANRDGRMVPLLINAAPLFDPAGVLLGAVSVWREIAHMKRLERMREEWAAIVAHDLRQPLSVIKMADAILTRAGTSGDPSAQCALEAIVHAVARMNGMVDELLDTSLLEANRLVLCKAPLHVAALLRDAVASAELGDHTVRLEVGPDLPTIDADRARIERAVGNFLSNAVKYGTPGTEIVVALTRRKDALEVAVTNVGESLTREQIGNLFSRFYRAPSAQRATGLGLGLYIARGLVEAHGGRVECECSDGKVTFRITLPFKAVAAA